MMKRLVRVVSSLAVLLFFLHVTPAAGQSQTSAANAEAGSALAASLDAVDSLRTSGDFRQALSQLSTLQSEHPANAEILWRLALTRVDIGEQFDSEKQQSSLYTQALTNAEAALQADSTNAHSHLAVAISQGRVALNAGTKEKIRRSRAVKHHADRAIELDPDLAAAYHVRARWNREVADLGFFERAIVKTVYGGLPEASFEQSVVDFEKAIALEDKIIHHLEIARTYVKMDRESDAQKHLQTALAMDATDPDDPKNKREARELLDDIG